MRRKKERSKQGQTNKQGKATQHTQGSHFFLEKMSCLPRHSDIFSRKSDCLGCAVLLCLVCLFDLACFYLYIHVHVPRHSCFYTYMYTYLITHESGNGAADFVVSLSVARWTQHDEQEPCWDGNLVWGGGGGEILSIYIPHNIIYQYMAYTSMLLHYSCMVCEMTTHRKYV